MHKLFRVLLLMLAVGMSSANASERSLQLVLDNSAALQGASEALLNVKKTLFQVSEFRKDRRMRDYRIHIVTVSNPRNVFVGSARDLFRNGKAVLTAIAPVKNGCSDLVASLDQVALNIEIEKPKHVDIIVFSSLIHSGSPCERAKLTLPQEAPKGVKLQALAKHNVRFLWVHHLQLRPWLKAIKAAGLEKAKLLDQETTKQLLNKGLKP